MKEDVVVISVIDVIEKIVDRNGRIGRVEFDADISLIGIYNHLGSGHQIRRQ